MSEEKKTVPVAAAGGRFTAEQMRALAEAAERFGGGQVLFTTRQTAELIGAEESAELAAFLAGVGLTRAPTGPHVRPVVCCKATLCPRGQLDSFAAARALHERFTVGWRDVTLPHKFNIAVGGCPNNCAGHTLNDLGVVGWRGGYRIYVGGRAGRRCVPGQPLRGIFPDLDSVLACVERTLRFYCRNAQPRERFGAMIERLGFEAVESALTDE